MGLQVFLIVCALVVIIAVVFGKVSRSRGYKKHQHKYSYIPPVAHGWKSGWVRAKHASRWVKARLLGAPDYEPQQGIHYYPYCRGRHFEYLCDGNGDIYKRRLHRH